MRIRTILRWLLGIAGGLLGLAVAAVLVVHVVMGRELSRSFDVEPAPVDIPEDAASIAEGERLSRIHGCNGGCHGRTVNGYLWEEFPDGSRFLAPDLARAVRSYSAPELEGIIRHGVRPDGTSIILGMPSFMFQDLTDEDLGAIIAYLRTQQPGEDLGKSHFGPIGRLVLLMYKRQYGTILAAEEIEQHMGRAQPALQASLQQGRYLAMTSCTECHGYDLRGFPDDTAPSLAIAVAYSEEDFLTLMRTGVPLGGRELDLMARVVKGRTAYLTDDEIRVLHRYLQTLAGTATSP